jgi:hypothetical protein
LNYVMYQHFEFVLCVVNTLIQNCVVYQQHLALSFAVVTH